MNDVTFFPNIEQINLEDFRKRFVMTSFSATLSTYCGFTFFGNNKHILISYTPKKGNIEVEIYHKGNLINSLPLDRSGFYIFHVENKGFYRIKIKRKSFSGKYVIYKEKN